MTKWRGKERDLNLFLFLYLDEGTGGEIRGEKNREKMRGEGYKWFLN